MGCRKRGTLPIARAYIESPYRNIVVCTQGISEGATRFILSHTADSLTIRLILNYDNFVVKSAR